MKNKILVTSLLASLSVPVSAMVKDFSVGIGYSEIEGTTKNADYSSNQPTFNYGLTFDSNMMVGIGITGAPSVDKYNSLDISNGLGGLASSETESLSFNNIFHAKTGYEFETNLVHITPYIGVSRISTDYKHEDKRTYDRESIKDTHYVPFIGADFTFTDFRYLSVGIRYTDSTNIAQDVDMSSSVMATLAFRMYND